MNKEELAMRFEKVADQPLHRFLGLRMEKDETGEARVIMPPSDNAANAAGVVHGGILYAVLDKEGTWFSAMPRPIPGAGSWPWQGSPRALWTCRADFGKTACSGSHQGCRRVYSSR